MKKTNYWEDIPLPDPIPQDPDQEKPDVMDEIQLRFAVAHFLATHEEKQLFEIVLEEVESAREK